MFIHLSQLLHFNNVERFLSSSKFVRIGSEMFARCAGTHASYIIQTKLKWLGVPYMYTIYHQQSSPGPLTSGPGAAAVAVAATASALSPRAQHPEQSTPKAARYAIRQYCGTEASLVLRFW